MDLEVVVEGVSDPRIATDIERKIRQVWKGAQPSGDWSIMLSPSEMRGHWDFGVRGPFGRHFASFAEPEHIDHLPELVAKQFRALL